MSLRHSAAVCVPVGSRLKAVPRCALEEECPICLENLYTEALDQRNQPVRVFDGPFEIATNCGHVYHRRCFLSLVTTGQPPISEQCPVCKTPFDGEEIADARLEASKKPPPSLATLTRTRRAGGLRPPSRRSRPYPDDDATIGAARAGNLPSLAMLKRSGERVVR